VRDPSANQIAGIPIEDQSRRGAYLDQSIAIAYNQIPLGGRRPVKISS
jgi:hypothetical protein